jgi:hypothetical protein
MPKSDTPGTVRLMVLDVTESSDARLFKIARSTLDFALREKACTGTFRARKKKTPPLERGGAL